MKHIIAISIMVLLVSFVYGQTYDIVPGQSEINYLRSEPGGLSSTEQEIELKVAFIGPAPATTLPITLVITNPYVLPSGINPVIVTPVGGYNIETVKFKSSWDTIKFKVKIRIGAIVPFENSEFFDIQMVGKAQPSNPRHRVIIGTTSTIDADIQKEEKKKNKLEIGAVSIGHSFDFFTKDNALISYADAYVFNPNSISIGKNAKQKKYGFAVKLYQNKSVTVDSLNNSGNLYKFINQTLVNPLEPPVNDSVSLRQEILTRKTSYKSDNWGMYIRLFRDISYTTNDKTKFYLGLHGEFLRRNIITTYEYKTEKDTIIKIKSDEVPYQGMAPVGRNAIQSEFYVAPYIEFVHHNEDINVRFSLIPAGLNVYRSTILNNATKNKLFFLGQFDLLLNKINIKVGAECRGLYQVRSQPYWNVFISKSLSWEKLKELLN